MEAVAIKPVTQTNLTEDYHLIQQAVCGDQRAFASLMERYRDSIFRTMQKMVLNKDDAEDLTQEAFGKAFYHLESYRPHFAFSTWLFRIAINNCIDHIRKKRLPSLSIDWPVESEYDHDLAGNLRAAHLDPEEIIIREQRQEWLRRLLVQLSDRHRLILEMRYFEEMSYEEIATALNIPSGTVKAQLHRAREALYNLLQHPGAHAYLEAHHRR